MTLKNNDSRPILTIIHRTTHVTSNQLMAVIALVSTFRQVVPLFLATARVESVNSEGVDRARLRPLYLSDLISKSLWGRCKLIVMFFFQGRLCGSRDREFGAVIPKVRGLPPQVYVCGHFKNENHVCNVQFRKSVRSADAGKII